jgi:hypothetical protein
LRQEICRKNGRKIGNKHEICQQWQGLCFCQGGVNIFQKSFLKINIFEIWKYFSKNFWKFINYMKGKI